MDLHNFDWPVDRDGYAIELTQGKQYVRACGGPSRNYRPLEDAPGLWREFVDTCNSVEGVLTFVNAYGLLDPSSSDELGRQNELVEQILSTAISVRNICAAMDCGETLHAVELFGRWQPRLRAGIRHNEKGRLEFYHRPETLRGAILLQTGEAITGSHRFRRCECPGCSRWFRLGPGAHSSRRRFCTDRCRVAADRFKKKGQSQ